MPSMRPLLLGHRGARASRHIAENSLPSFELCLQHGCDGFEFDVRRSADDVGVICHNPVVGSLEIERSAANELDLPALEQVLQKFSSRAFLDIELKVAGLEKHLVAALGRNPPRKGYVVSSFLPEVLHAVYEQDPGIPLGILWEKRDGHSRDAGSMESRAPRPATSGNKSVPEEFPVQWLIPRVDLVDRELIGRAHAEGKKVMVWTVNRAEQMRQLAAWGVDAIISDDTELLMQLLG